jgi:hypothetical protein
VGIAPASSRDFLILSTGFFHTAYLSSTHIFSFVDQIMEKQDFGHHLVSKGSADKRKGPDVGKTAFWA